MPQWYQQVLQYWQMTSAWELVAVSLGITYLVLAAKENSLCWYAAFIQTLIFMVLFWDASLLMESGLQIYYLIMAVYGWYQWRHPDNPTQTSLQQRPIRTWTVQQHTIAISAVLALSVISGYLLEQNTQAALPYLDSFTTWGSVITTYMVTKKILENWLYWLVVDSISIYLYIDRGLYATAVLFFIYLIIVVIGYWQWLKHYQNTQYEQTPCNP